VTRSRGGDAAGGGYWNPSPSDAVRPGTVEVRVRGAEPMTLATASHTFSPRRLDPGTALLLEAILAHCAGPDIPPPGRIADLGAGYGAVGLVLARRFPAADVDLFERNERAALVARANAQRHDLARAHVVVGDVAAQWHERAAYDMIATNPPIRAGRAVYGPWLTGAADHLRPGGSFWFVCRTAQGADTLRALLATSLPRVEVAARRSGYRVVMGSLPPVGTRGV
jgi:16S rRNA (guanine1207-N2)-methyltransferase